MNITDFDLQARTEQDTGLLIVHKCRLTGAKTADTEECCVFAHVRNAHIDNAP